MKKIFISLAFMLSMFGMYSCSKDNGGDIIPSDVTNLRADTQNKPGFIVLRWDTPDNQTIKYIQVTYHDYLPGKEVLRSASIYADSILIPNTRKKFGEYEFYVQTFSESNQGGSKQVIKVVSEPAEKQITLNGESQPIHLTKDQIYADTDDGSNVVTNLVDGNISSFYHADWASPKPFPHYIVIDLKKEIGACNFSYTTRDHANKDHPKVVNIYGSNEFNGTTYDISKATLLAKIESGLPDTGNTSYKSGNLIGKTTFKYFWFEVMSSVSGNNYYALSEFSVTELGTKIIDPEAE